MAQRAIIGINGELTPFDASLDKIRTPGIGASSVTWGPDADTRCTSLRVTANGTYNAAQRGDYGYDYVTVSVPGTSVTGKDPATGEEKQVTVNPETGEIEETVLPTEIRVTTPPTKTTYTNGETIDYSGIVVHAYSATGQDMGAVPFNELVFPVTTAHADGDAWTDGQGLNAMMLYYTPHQWFHYNSKGEIDQQGTNYVHGSALGTYVDAPATYGSNENPGTLLVTRYNGYNYAASLTGAVATNMYVLTPTENWNNWSGWLHVGGSAYRATEIFTRAVFQDEITNIPQSTKDPTGIDPTTLHAVQALPVQWSRTGDGAVLETSFDIQVTSSGGDAA